MGAWINVSVLRNGADPRSVVTAHDVLTTLGEGMRGISSIPSTDSMYFTIFDGDLDRFTRICSRYGFTVVSVGPDGGLGHARVDPAFQENERRLREFQDGLEMARRRVSRVGVIPPGAVDNAPAPGDIVMNGDNLRVAPPAPQTSRLNKLIGLTQEKSKIAEKKIKDLLDEVKVDVTVVEKMTEVMLACGNDIRQKVRIALDNSVSQYEQVMANMRKSIGPYQVQKFLYSKLTDITDAANTPKEKEQREKVFDALSGIFGKNKKDYEEDFAKGVASILSQIKNSDIEKQMEINIKNVVTLGAQVETNRRLLDASLSDRREALKKTNADHIDRIVKYPFVRGVRMYGNNIVVTYDAVTLRHDGKLWPLGTYTATIDIGHSSIKLTADEWGLNQSYQGPHITSGGSSICWGNLSEGVRQLMADWNWSFLVHVIWNFLNVYNPADRFCDLEHLFVTAVKRKPLPIPEQAVVAGERK